MRDHFEGSWEVCRERMAEAPSFDFGRFGAPFEVYGYACCYTPDPDRPGEGLVPFELDTGRLIDELWERWLALDPVRMAPDARRRAALDAPHLPRRRPRRRVVPRSRRPGVLRRARQAVGARTPWTCSTGDTAASAGGIRARSRELVRALR